MVRHFAKENQECPNARTAIKFLVEDGRFDYVETGSLLGVRYKEIRSYPVGFEELYRMYPMDFEEYMWANGVQKSTIDYLQECFDSFVPVSASVHDTIQKLFLSYIVVGGMPQVVQTYVESHDIGRVVAKQKELLELYRLDIARYAGSSDKIKIKAIFDSIPAQLANKNRRFILTNIEKNARQNRYENSFVRRAWKISSLIFCRGNVEKAGAIVYLPWYMSMFYKPEEVQSMKFEIDLSGLVP